MTRKVFHLYPVGVSLTLLLAGCQGNDTLFEELSGRHTNVQFENQLIETEDINVLHYDYLYNGAGVAVGDLNNDGLPDLYFSGNTVSNKLYLNTGDLTFRDVTEESGIAEKEGWKTGVTMVDVNADGWLDIYLCYAGLRDHDRSNQLFVNNGLDDKGNVSFTDRAKEYGVDAPGTYSTQSYFFDYDIDGDVDMFLLNHGIDYNSSFANAIQRKSERHPEFGNRLYRNDSGKFTDVSDSTGISGGWLNYGLSATISDYNGDGFPDLYVSNDFDERDFFYVNNGDGSFREALKESFPHISKFTMGSDAADINNDSRPDLITLDMLPEDNYRQKLLKGPDNFDKYYYFVNRGFHFQQMRNMLHLNQGLNQDGVLVFSEIGQLAGVSNTDWSWASLFADYDNDGYRDLFVTNGYLRDFTNLDFQKYDFEEARRQLVAKGFTMQSEEGRKFMFEYVNKMSPIKVSNYIFRNRGDLTFENVGKDWGIIEEGLSNGAAYADLDADGDLDLVVNNLNSEASIYRNNARERNKNNYIQVRLNGDNKNSMAIGSKVKVKLKGGEEIFAEAHFGRGFLSSVDPVMHFGIGQHEIEAIRVEWYDGTTSVLQNPAPNQTLKISYPTQRIVDTPIEVLEKHELFSDVSRELSFPFQHKENNYVDYRSERLLLFKLSHQGPKLSKGDVDGDGLEDVFIGGASGQSSQLFKQYADGTFRPFGTQPWSEDEKCEDVASVMFDADGDADLDLYVVSGGNEFDKSSPMYQDRLYLNGGRGRFAKIEASLPSRGGSGSCVTVADYDDDGDIDIFVGGWTLPGAYPRSSRSLLLRNETTKGVVKFKDVTEEVAPGMTELGVIRDAKWLDVDGDNRKDLVVVGDWAPVKIFRNEGGQSLAEITADAGLDALSGFWSSIGAGDFDEDGDIDLLVGNLGLNSELKASADQPLQMYVADFSGDGNIDPIVCNYVKGVSYPIATRDEILSQILPLRKKFIRYSEYAKATISDVLDSSQLKKADIKTITRMESSILWNDGKGHFSPEDLPLQVQFAPVQSFLVRDFNGDGNEDVLVGGNFIPYRAEYGPFDASIGVLLIGDGKGKFEVVDRSRSGVLLSGDVRDIVEVKSQRGQLILVSRNNDSIQVLLHNATAPGTQAPQ